MAKTLIQNRKARYDYHIEDTYEAGIALKGPEVKSLRAGKGNIQDAYISFRNGEAFILNMHISPYEQANIFNEDPTRTRKLLLNKREIRKLEADRQRQGYTIIPTKVYLNNRGLVKVEVATAKGKKTYDKREDIKRRDAQREIQRSMKYN